MLLSAVYGTLYLPSVQTTLAGWLTKYLKNSYGLVTSIERVKINFFKTVELDKVYIEDLSGDTLLYAEKLSLNIDAYNLKKNTFKIKAFALKNASFNLIAKNEQSPFNLDEVLALFASKDTTAADTTPLSLRVSKLKLDNIHFKYQLLNDTSHSYGVDYEDLDVQHAYLDLSDIEVLDDSIVAKINAIKLKEKSGFVLHNLSGMLSLSSTVVDVQNLAIVTPKSSLKGSYRMDFKSWGDYLDYNHKVRMTVQLESSKVHTDDIAYYAPELKEWHQVVSISGTCRGKVDNLRNKNLDLKWLSGTRFKGNFDISGLPDFDNSFITLNAKQIATNPADLNKIIKLVSPSNEPLPEHLNQLGTITFGGSFTGFPNNFTSYGILVSKAGIIKTDLSLKELNNNYQYKGRLATQALDLGMLTNISSMGTLSSDFELEGQGLKSNDIKADVVGNFSSFNFSGYEYKNLALNGQFEQLKFAGLLTSSDPNANFDFNGEVDFREKLPLLYFDAAIYAANLSKLNLVEDSVQSELSATLQLRAKGIKLSEITGSVNVLNLSYCQRGVTYPIGDFKLTASNYPARELKLESPVAEIKVNGNFIPEALPNSFIDLIAEAVPALKSPSSKAVKQSFTFNAQLKDLSPLELIVREKVYVDPGTTISGFYDNVKNAFEIKLLSKSFEYGSMHGTGMDLSVKKNNNVLSATLENQSFYLRDSLHFDKVDILAKAIGNNIQMAVEWQNDERNNGKIEGVGLVKGKNSFELDLLPLAIKIAGDDWRTKQNAQLYYDRNKLAVRSLEIYNQEQSIAVNGRISKFNEDRLNFDIKNINLKSFGFLLADNIKLKGLLNGNGYLSNPYENLKLQADLSINQLELNGDTLGDLLFNANWIPSDSTINVLASLGYANAKSLELEGVYKPFAKNEDIDLDVIFNEFNLGILNTFGIEELNNFSGKLNGKLAASGKASEPKLFGRLRLENAGLHIAYLNTTYTLNDYVVVRPDWIGFNNIRVLDEKGNKASVSGTAYHKNFQQWNYDIGVQMRDFLCMNTNAKQNELFYGIAYATGSANISGYDGKLEIELNATTNKNTSVAIPLGGSEEVYAQEFVRFINSKEENLITEELDLQGISLKLDIDVTSDAELKLIFDEKIGDVITGRGNGRINLEITPAGEFLMFGKYEITQGDYLFTLRNVINKHFKVQKGGTINWFGNPYEAYIDLVAEYNLRSALQNIMSLSDDRYKRTEPVKCIMKMGGRLLQPDIKFDIDVPNGDDLVRGQLAALSNDANELNKQFLSLLITNSFTPIQNGVRSAETTAGGANTVGNNSMELLSNQLNNWLNGISRNFSLGVNLKNGDELNSGEYMVTVARQFFDNRVTLTTDFGSASRSLAQQQGSNTNSNLVGNFVAEYNISEDGRFRVKAFRQAADNFYISNSLSPYLQGAGVFYQEQFDSFKELRSNFANLFVSKKRKLAKENAPKQKTISSDN